MSTLFRNQKKKNKASEVMKMNFAQVLKNKSKIFKSGTFRNSLVFLEQMGDNNKKNDFDKKIDFIEIENILENQNDEKLEIIDEQSLIMNKIELLLIEQKIEKALYEYNLLLEIQKNNCSFEFYIKKKKYEKIILDELKKILGSIKINSNQPNFEIVKNLINPMLKLKKYKNTIKIILEYISSCLRFEKKILSKKNFEEKKNFENEKDLEEIVIDFMSVILSSSKFIDENFNEFFFNNEHFVIFGNWFCEEFKIFLENYLEGIDDENRNEVLKEISIYCLDFEVKGLGVDFMVKEFVKIDM